MFCPLDLGLQLLDDVALLDQVVLDLDPGDLGERLGELLRLVLVRGDRLGDDVDLHAAVRRGGLDEPVQLRELLLLGQRARRELAGRPTRWAAAWPVLAA